MLDELAMVFQVARCPNATFAALRDNDHRYFQSSIVVLLLTSIAYVGLDLSTPELAGQPTLDAPTSVRVWYAAFVGYIFTGQLTLDAPTSFGLTILGAAAGAGTIYLVGRAFGGNKSWRKALTVLFYTGIVWIPAAAVQPMTSIQFPGLQAVVGAVALAALAWAVILSVKAVKVLNGFGTAKASGILVLSCIIYLVVLIIPIILTFS